MSSRSRWKLLTALVLGFAALGVIGWQRIPPGPVTPAATTLTPTVTRVSASQTTVVPSRPTEWIKISQVKPVDYYLSLLYSNGTSPYGHLYWELRKLPELTNATAVAKITYLALNATNPEVKEAFTLMMKGGTPDPKDFTYKVPECNTELQVLYWLACQNDFKKDDTLALAIAMVNGLWVTMGDEQVKEAVRNDTSDLLNFLRETNELQKQKGCFQLEDYPLEAKIALAWTGNDTPAHGPYALAGPHYARTDYRKTRLGLKGYEWNNVSVKTLYSMRNTMDQKNWMDRDVNKVVENLEHYFWFGRRAWTVTSFDDTIMSDNESYCARNLNNADFEFQYFAEFGKGIGVCEDRMTLLDALCKSWGISTIPKLAYWSAKNPNDPKLYSGHTHILYFDPRRNAWTGYQPTDRLYEGELLMGEDGIANENTPVDVYVLKLPVIQRDYLGMKSDYHMAVVQSPHTWSGELNNSFYSIYNTTLRKTYELFSKGVSSSQMKQWLLYS